MITKGTLLKSTTKTLNDVFGEVLWEVVEVGLDAKDKLRPGVMDGMWCVMVGGTGPAARVGYRVFDTEERVGQDIAAGTTQVVPPEQREALLRRYSKKEGGKCATGAMEV